MSGKDLLLIVPAYNERENLAAVMEEIAAFSFADALIVDDGSMDGTRELIRENGWRAISLHVNMGLSCAVETGMRYALEHEYDYAMQFDADGQHIARYVPQMLSEARARDLDVLIGSRGGARRGLRGLGARMISFSIRVVTGQRIQDPTSGMRLYSARVMRLFVGSLNLRPEPDALSYIIRSGARVGEYPVEMRPRTKGRSYLGALGSMKYMLEMALSILILQPGRVRGKLDREVSV